MRVTIASSTSSMPMPDLRGGHHRVVGGEADNVLDLLADLFGLGGGEVDLVDDGDDLMVVLDALIHIRKRLSFDALRRIHHQQRPLARGQASAHFIREVHMPRRVHEVEDIGLAVLGE
jgi:hypothetical protein